MQRISPWIAAVVVCGARLAAASEAPVVSVPNDARAGEAWLSPTALTPKRGTVTVSLHELVAPTVSYALTDRLEIGAGGTVLPWLRAAAAGAKLHLLDRPDWGLHGALVAGGLVGTLDLRLGTGPSPATFGAVRAGGVLSACLFSCRALVSAFGGALVWTNDGDVDPLGGANVTVALGPHVKLVSEGTFLPGSALLIAALRVHAWRFAIDGGIGALADDWRQNGLDDTQRFPVLSVSYGWVVAPAPAVGPGTAPRRDTDP